MIVDIEKLIEHICSEIRDFTDTAVIGLSGGADSTLVAVLCKRALGKENVYGVSMPYSDFDKETFNRKSYDIAETLGIKHVMCPVKEIADAINFQVFYGTEDFVKVNPVNDGNARSRARMCVLYGIAHNLDNKGRVRVIGTGNLSEDYIGYDTKGGDALADIFPIGNLFKSEVYQLLDYFKDEGILKEEHIDRIPSAGLEEGQTDANDLGYTYDEMEPYINFCLYYNKLIPNHDEEIMKFVIERNIRNKHKHETPFIVQLRKFCD